ncbi:MAG: DUF2252 family protein [Magnetococcales bacterium]|nr:DUF2252 family protein [Magnetococcales bacterium]
MTSCDITKIIHRDPKSVQDYPNYAVNKLASSTDAFIFFRSFVPCFYCYLKSNQTWNSPVFDALRSFVGWCAGDAHPKNFGVLPLYLTSGEKKLVFAMNDPDDGDLGLPIYDILRLLTGIHFVDTNSSPKTLRKWLQQALCAYLAGLASGDFPSDQNAITDFLSDCGVSNSIINDMVCSKNSKCFHCDEKYGETKNGELVPVCTSGKTEINIQITPEEMDALDRFVENDCYLKGYKIKYYLAYMKTTGGSGYLRQYRICLHDKDLDSSDPFRHVILDIKPECNSSVHYEQMGHNVKQILARVNTNLRKERGGELCRFNRAVAIPALGCGAFLIRARWDGQEGIDTDKIPDNPGLLCAEAKILGITHRNAMINVNDVDAYQSVVETMQSELILLAGEMAAAIEHGYQCCCLTDSAPCSCCDEALRLRVHTARSPQES